MFMHVFQAALVIIMLLFPFAFNSDFVENYDKQNICATVDSAIMKAYTQNGVVPSELNRKFMENMGISEKFIKDLNYQKISDREFELTYNDTENEEKHSIHSYVLLPLIEKDVEKYKLSVIFDQVQALNEQCLYVTLPDSDKREGYYFHTTLPDSKDNERFTFTGTFPVGTKFEIKNMNSWGTLYYKTLKINGILQNGTNFSGTLTGVLTKDMEYHFGETIPRQHKITYIKDSRVPVPVIMKIEYQYMNKPDEIVSISPGQTKLVDTGSVIYFDLPENFDPTKYGFSAAYAFPFSKMLWDESAPDEIFVTLRLLGNITSNPEPPKPTYTLSVANTKHQTIKVEVRDSNDGTKYTLTNGQSRKVGFDSRFTASIVPDAGYVAGKLNYTKGNVTKNLNINAMDAYIPEPSKPEPPLSGGRFHLVDWFEKDNLNDKSGTYYMGFDKGKNKGSFNDPYFGDYELIAIYYKHKLDASGNIIANSRKLLVEFAKSLDVVNTGDITIGNLKHTVKRLNDFPCILEGPSNVETYDFLKIMGETGTTFSIDFMFYNTAATRAISLHSEDEEKIVLKKKIRTKIKSI